MREDLFHTTVLLEKTVSLLPLDTGKLFVDGTLGGGGHAERLLCFSDARLIAIDKDADAIARSKARLEPYGDRVTFVQDDFKNIKYILNSLGEKQIDGAILDLGVSSFQLDEVDRGFSYMKDAPIDMRMDRSAKLSGYDVVNGYDKENLKKIIYTYGEERFGGRIADAIVKNRPIETTLQLAEVIKSAIPASSRRGGPHPAKRTFQAIRIEVNGELDKLGEAMEDFVDALALGGVLAVITFHSLEDRAVKQAFKTAENPCTCPPDFPICVCGKVSKGSVLTKKPLLPEVEELGENPRARSAKLRAFLRR